MSVGLRKDPLRKSQPAAAQVPQQNSGALVTPDAQQRQWESQRIVNAADRGEHLVPSKFDEQGRPAHRSYPSGSLGQFIRVTSNGAGSYVEVEHDLGRKPHGCIWLDQPTARSYLVMGATSASSGLKSTDKKAVFYMAGPADELGICLLF